MKLETLLFRYKHVEFNPKPNLFKLKKEEEAFDEDGCKLFNTLSLLLGESDFAEIDRTRSGGISVKHLRYPAYDIEINPKSFIAQIITITGYGMWRFKWGYAKDSPCGGREGYNFFRDLCEKHGLYLEKYFENDKKKAKEVKESIVWPKVDFYMGNRNHNIGKLLEDVHHLDLNSSYMSGLVHELPEFREPVEELYKKKKEAPKGSEEKELYKAYLVVPTGYFQSQYFGYKLSHLSKIMIEYNNKRIDELTEKLIAYGCEPILYNTDGIWYRGPIYHDEDEGTELGQWKNDHINCKFRAKSAGCYEFEENGIYYPVIRGRSNLDKECPDRTKWGEYYGGMGAIYMADVIDIYYDNKLERMIYDGKEVYLDEE